MTPSAERSGGCFTTRGNLHTSRRGFILAADVLPLIILAVALAFVLPFLFAYKSIYSVPTPLLWALSVVVLPLGCAVLVVSVSKVVPGF